MSSSPQMHFVLAIANMNLFCTKDSECSPHQGGGGVIMDVMFTISDMNSHISPPSCRGGRSVPQIPSSPTSMAYQMLAKYRNASLFLGPSKQMPIPKGPSPYNRGIKAQL